MRCMATDSCVTAAAPAMAPPPIAAPAAAEAKAWTMGPAARTAPSPGTMNIPAAPVLRPSRPPHKAPILPQPSMRSPMP